MSRRNLINFTIALVLALVAWASIRLGADNQMSLNAKIRLTGIPDGLIVTERLRESVTVTLRGTRAGLSRIKEEDLALDIDISGRTEGIANLELDAAQLKPVPSGVTVLSIAPPVISVKLESVMESMLPVKENILGTLPDGYSLRLLEIHPAQVQFKGPARLGKKLKEILTEPVEARTLVKQPEREVSLISSSEVFPYLNPRKVTIRADLAEETIDREIVVTMSPRHRDGFNVVAAPPTVTVKVAGPASIVSTLSKASFQVEADFSPYPPGRYKRVSPRMRIEGPGVQNGLEILYGPKQFDIAVSPRDGK